MSHCRCSFPPWIGSFLWRIIADAVCNISCTNSDFCNNLVSVNWQLLGQFSIHRKVSTLIEHQESTPSFTIKSSKTIDTFREKLQTYLFEIAFHLASITQPLNSSRRSYAADRQSDKRNSFHHTFRRSHAPMTTFVCCHWWLRQLIVFVAPRSWNFQGYRRYTSVTVITITINF